MGQFIDVFIIVVCIVLSVRAVARGFVVELFSLLAFVVGFFGAKYFGPFVFGIIGSYGTESLMKIVAYSITFLLFYIFSKIIEKQMEKMVHVILLSGLNRILGFVFGILEGMIIVSIISYILVHQTIIAVDFQAMMSESRVLAYISSLFNEGKGFLGL